MSGDHVEREDKRDGGSKFVDITTFTEEKQGLSTKFKDYNQNVVTFCCCNPFIERFCRNLVIELRDSDVNVIG